MTRDFSEKARDKLQDYIKRKAGELDVTSTHYIFRGDITPEFNLLLKTGLKERNISSNGALLQSIDTGKSNNILIPIGLCLRYGASPNMYVNFPLVSKNIHILAYTILKMTNVTQSQIDGDPHRKDVYRADDNVIMMTLLMLIASGSDPNRPVFDPNAGYIQSEAELKSSEVKPTVQQWFREQGYIEYHKYLTVNIMKDVDEQTRTLIGLLLNRVDMITSGSFQTELAVKSLIEEDILMMIRPSKFMMDWYHEELYTAVKYINQEAFIHFLRLGLIPSYPLFNKLFILAKEYYDIRDYVSEKSIIKMISVSVGYGMPMDGYQMGILSSIDRVSYDEVMTEYHQPYWKKACRGIKESHFPVSERLKRMVVTFNIPDYSSGEYICKTLQEITRKDPNELKSAAIRRQQGKMLAELSHIDEYTLGGSINCENRAVLGENPYDYSDISLSYYRDSKGRIWCFTSNLFSSLVKTKLNPHTNENLPEVLILDIKYKLKLHQDLGLSEKPHSVSNGIDSLTTKDNPLMDTVLEEDRLMKKFDDILEEQGISVKKVNELSIEEINNQINLLGLSVDTRDLVQGHLLKLFAWILVWTHSNNITKFEFMIRNLQAIS